MTSAQDFAAYLERAMDASGATAADLARAVGVKDSVVSRWRKGTIPTVENLRLLAPVLKVPVRDLVVAAGHMRPEEVGLAEVPEPPGPDVTPEEKIMDQDWMTDEEKAAMVTFLGSLRTRHRASKPKRTETSDEHGRIVHKRGA